MAEICVSNVWFSVTKIHTATLCEFGGHSDYNEYGRLTNKERDVKSKENLSLLLMYV